MLAAEASSTSAARLPDQKEHAAEIAGLKQQRTGQRRDDCQTERIQSDVNNQSIAAQDQPQEPTKGCEVQRRSPGFSA